MTFDCERGGGGALCCGSKWPAERPLTVASISLWLLEPQFRWLRLAGRSAAMEQLEFIVRDLREQPAAQPRRVSARW